jgi:hypothetical protein
MGGSEAGTPVVAVRPISIQQETPSDAHADVPARRFVHAQGRHILKSMFTWVALRLAVSILAITSTCAWACTSCGCTLDADWAGQGIKSVEGLSIDLRLDVSDQNDLRSGTHRIDAHALPLPSDTEIQLKTSNRNATLSLDYGFDADWGASVQLPYLRRDHTTLAEGDVEPSTSHSSGLGDVRILARYQGFYPEHDWGLQFGLKLPTGSTLVDFSAGPQAGQPLDRGLQPGTGSVDLLMEIYRFGRMHSSVDYFVQALLQQPLTSKDNFKPGASANLTLGVRYAGPGSVVPHLQINVRAEGRESGSEADVANSGATLAYLSPGITWRASEGLQVYAFAQVPVYQRVNGLQLEARFSLSAGLNQLF